MGTIYMATNKVNGKKYIGQTTTSIKRRIYYHLLANGRCPALSAAIKKYGRSAFEWRVLADGVLLQSELDRLEDEYIVNYGTIAPHGYNLRRGGQGTGALHEDTKRKIGEKSRKRWADPEYKANMETKLREHRSANPPASEDERRRRKRERARIRLLANPRQSKMQSNWHREVKSRREEKARRSETVRKEIIQMGEREWYRQKGMSWMSDHVAIARWKANHTLCDRCQPKRIVCIETGVEYESQRRACVEHGIDSHSMRNAVRDQRRTAGGYHWAERGSPCIKK
jgi:group I intron endonuclease